MNKTTIIAVVSFFIIGSLVGSQWRGCSGGRGARGEGVIHSDTVVKYLPRTDTVWHAIAQAHNIPFTVWGHDTVYVSKTEIVNGHDTTWLTQYRSVSDTAAYSDTLRQAHEFMAEIFDTLYNNRIIARSVRWADLAPIELRTVTNTVLKKQALVKVFLGADAYGGEAGQKLNIDIAPAASFVFADRYMVDLGYYIFNRELTAGLKVKLSFRR